MLHTKMMANDNESTNIKNLRAIMERFGKGARKGLQAGVLAASLAASTMSAANSSPLTSLHDSSILLERHESRTPNPYDTVIGGYACHNFIGEKPNIVWSTAKNDVNNYLRQGVAYLQGQFAKFTQSVSDRPDVHRYFAQFDIDFTTMSDRHHHHHEISDSEKMDYYVNKITKVCRPIFDEIINNIKDPDQKEAFSICYRALANEWYKEGLGQARNEDNAMMQKYNQERAAITAEWSQNNFLRANSLDNDINQFKCRRVADRLYTLVHNAGMSMNENNKLLRDLKNRDLRSVINLSLHASSLAAMHDYTAEMLEHKWCNMDLNLVHSHQNTITDQAENDIER